LIKEILEPFRRATSLATNLNKSKAFPIRCDEAQLDLIAHTLGCECVDFLRTYLGGATFSLALAQICYAAGC
jgi:hypothetical protein